MPLYLGNIKKKVPYDRIYLGSILKFQKGGNYVDTEFSSSIAPTDWTTVSLPSEFKATNDYGTWNISASSALYNNSGYTKNLFDGDDDTRWTSANKASEDDIILQLPENICIIPKTIKIRYSYLATDSLYVRGLNRSTNEWELIGDSSCVSSTSIGTKTIENTVENAYSQFKITATGGGTTLNARLYNFEITEGTVRQYEN